MRGRFLRALVIAVSVLALMPAAAAFADEAGVVTRSESASQFVGTWKVWYDWGCDGEPGVGIFHVRANGTFEDSFRGDGTWIARRTKIILTYTGGTVNYYGTLTTNRKITGTMENPFDTGCWHAKKTGSTALVSADPTQTYGQPMRGW